MTEETENDRGPQNPAQMLALTGASRAKADAWLELQMEEMRAEEPYKLSHFRLRRFSGWAKAAFEFSAGLLALAVAAGVAFLVWNAANSNDLVIDSFQVPPELAARGLSGPVVAAKLSDKIAKMQSETTSQRAPKSYANGISDGLKLEIPETGVSLSELDRFLRAKLGHDLHISGEVVQAEKGIALTARVGTEGSPSVTGAEADIDALLQKLAEQVYGTTQPYRYSVWLQAHGRVAEGVAILKELAASGPPKERAWDYNGWAVATTQGQSARTGMALLRRGFALDPDNYLLAANLDAGEYRLGQMEESARHARMALAAVSAHGRDYTQPERIAPLIRAYKAQLLALQGDLLQAAIEQRALVGAGTIGNAQSSTVLAEILTALHEPTAAGTTLTENPPGPNIANLGTYKEGILHARLLAALEAQDWVAVLSAERDVAALMAQYPGLVEEKPAMFEPLFALALAHLGNFAAAEARLSPMPGDCYPCLRTRAQVAALQGQDARADWWFARAAAAAPSLPYAEAEWGRALFERKQPDAAIEKFTAASKKGPHFADPIEGWGEALMAKSQSHLALAKFAEAEKYAPNWGRLQLKWGEALTYAGKKDEAAKHFARAATLDLTPEEKTELAKAPHG